jgi:hypothetical protein
MNGEEKNYRTPDSEKPRCIHRGLDADRVLPIHLM